MAQTSALNRSAQWDRHYPWSLMSDDADKARPRSARLEQPLHTRKRLAVPTQPVGEPPTRFANMSLGLNATFCNIVGLVFTLTGAFMADRLGAPGWALTVFGVVVLLWSFMVTLYANRRISRHHEVGRVIRINIVIIALGALILVWPGAMTNDGKIVLGVWTLFTVGFTAAQLLAQRKLPKTNDAA